MKGPRVKKIIIIRKTEIIIIRKTESEPKLTKNLKLIGDS